MEQPLGKQYGGSSKIYIELAHDPVSPLLGVFPKELQAGTLNSTYTYSQQSYSQQPKDGSNPTVHQWLNG